LDVLAAVVKHRTAALVAVVVAMQREVHLQIKYDTGTASKTLLMQVWRAAAYATHIGNQHGIVHVKKTAGQLQQQQRLWWQDPVWQTQPPHLNPSCIDTARQARSFCIVAVVVAMQREVHLQMLYDTATASKTLIKQACRVAAYATHIGSRDGDDSRLAAASMAAGLNPSCTDTAEQATEFQGTPWDGEKYAHTTSRHQPQAKAMHNYCAP
jgi:predicted RNase H-related nuclease YkuK (DUF458 family)